MTHNVDCSVKDSDRERITQIALDIYESGERRVPQDIRDELVDMGWEHKGSGAARSVWRVPQSDTGETPTEKADCVAKFATAGRGRISDGREQNGEEIANFRRLPDRLVDPDQGIPVFVPLRDWGGNNTWISMPEANAEMSAGDTAELKQRLLSRGWECEDIHQSNVGEMHGESVIVDYGMECYAVDPTAGIADDIADQLDSFGASRVDVDRVSTDTAVVEFLAPSGTPGAEDVRSMSSMNVTLARDHRDVEGVTFMELAFGTWDVQASKGIKRKVERGADQVVDEWTDQWNRSADMSWDSIVSDGLMDLYFEVEVAYGEPVPPLTAKNMYAEAVDLVMRHIPDQRAPDIARKQVERAIENELP